MTHHRKMDDSSPDLSLKLRRNSSDSRDSFYLDLDQGIDSDIEEMTQASTSGTAPLAPATSSGAGSGLLGPRLPSGSIGLLPLDQELTLDEEDDDDTITPTTHKTDETPCWGVGTPGGGVKAEGTLLPSPASPSAVIVSPETLSRHSSRQSSPGSARAAHHHASASTAALVEAGAAGAASSAGAATTRGAPTQAYLPPSRSMVSSVRYAAAGTGPGPGDALATTLSALYGKLIVVMGIAFPMAEVISTYIPPSFYEGFYLYLYFGSMLFLLYMYAMLLKDKAAASVSNSFKRSKRTKSISSNSDSDSAPPSPSPHTDTELSTATEQERYRAAAYRRQSGQFYHQQHYGSFYLRMGAVAFGIGSMIYSGLEFGQYFELERNTKCHNVLLALTPATRMAFIFIQMYFIFLNNEEMKVYKHRTLARFGLMHMIGTNLSVWLNVLIQETKHEILTFYNPENKTLGLPMQRVPQHGVNWFNFPFNTSASPTLPTYPVPDLPLSHGHGMSHLRVARGLKGPHHMYECRRTNIIGSLVQDASPFLFPCTIEYSLICAAILYVMWKNIAKMTPTTSSSHSLSSKLERAGAGLPGPYYKRSPHHYSVDCARAHKGLFVGILILVLTILSLILFFVLTSRKEFVYLAVIEVNICELSLYAMSTIATLLGMLKVRQLRYDGSRNLELDSILLIGAQTGMFLYSMFTVIGGHFTMEKNTALVLITALASLVQTTCQTMFVLDASRRSCVTPEQIRRKPGREIVTFLLVTNLAMWAINTLEKSRAESHPIQLNFYGLWAWTIITHVSMPLAIFYRFHSTVCLCEIWKKAYKMKPVYM
ncbi:proton channel OtopLc-like isoform X2 [Frankliniella occidentalis]|uniref:Proton channel OtopLc-like isoform X2 n=1 Tax=Frankliniella occidentalis TaxID=133901 RepID=A0A6J1RRY8_FRAOC|nr:proton channel OtopLc-like isoform X2 [Frankliniella occidentalis]